VQTGEIVIFGVGVDLILVLEEAIDDSVAIGVIVIIGVSVGI